VTRFRPGHNEFISLHTFYNTNSLHFATVSVCFANTHLGLEDTCQINRNVAVLLKGKLVAASGQTVAAETTVMYLHSTRPIHQTIPQS